jgi:hypothetical protein
MQVYCADKNFSKRNTAPSKKAALRREKELESR